MSDYSKSGFVPLYKIEKKDGSPIDPFARYFVLNLNSKDEAHRQASCAAALTYAKKIEMVNPVLAKDLKDMVEIWSK